MLYLEGWCISTWMYQKYASIYPKSAILNKHYYSGLNVLKHDWDKFIKG